MSIDIAYLFIYVAPLLFLGVICWGLFTERSTPKVPEKYQVILKLRGGRFKIQDIRKGVSIIGAAGSGKTFSVVYNLLLHFSKYKFSGVIHDYKDQELTEIALPLFKAAGVRCYPVSFDRVQYRINPIAPRYLPNEESVNEVAKVLMENLLEQNLSSSSGSNRFFTDAVEGLLAGLIWKLKSRYPQYCSLPHLIAVFQYLDTKSLVAFLSSDLTAKSMAGAFINGVDSEKQTAGVKSTLANAFKKISSQKMFYMLSADQIPLDINAVEHHAVISISNNPQYESAYSPIIATIIHTITKQMSVRQREGSFLLMEEAPTIKLPHMHRIPATLRSFNIATIYVMQDKIQNDMLYGDKASKAILSNLSYQFFGKVNDPDTAKYYERFFEIIKSPTKSVSKSSGLTLQSRVTKGEKEVSKRRAHEFFKLKAGEFIAFADGKDRKIKFDFPKRTNVNEASMAAVDSKVIGECYQNIFADVKSIFK